MALGAVLLALWAVVMFLLTVGALNWADARWERYRLAKRLQRYTEGRDQAEAKWSDGPGLDPRD